MKKLNNILKTQKQVFFYWKGNDMKDGKIYLYKPYRQMEKKYDLFYDKLVREEKNREYIDKLKEKFLVKKYIKMLDFRID